ncbi:dTDP-4-dehydrorhamnose 3,5-epimerase [Paraburkholderia phenoliruptrix]|uniref:dTDP-4-dehydrorhamnose 3,5-epimerase n=1 Tax=Paraburkholderia phenoliruptrix TaxID=252970 RepID=UPI002869AC91|nr:dTDP-4-dehydrorhamnose 3,5-epimerase [Paraburkholderia phenoliruptrix]WMY10960.1 dTDP-4-dehydrorhamnose 3,5-epimerase [Paraburkholderia phenoliruptrix]
MLYRIRHTRIRDVKIVEPHIAHDARGLSFGSFDQEWFEENVARGYTFVQDQHMVFARNVLTGLHYQVRQPQGLLLRVVNGEIFAVALDLRRWSPTFGRWVGERISAVNNWQLWIPPGFAYGFVVRSDVAEVLLRSTSKHNATFERTICWDDPDINIAWGMQVEPLVTMTSANGVDFRAVEVY